MTWYFVSWDIFDDKNEFVRWSNVIVKSDDNPKNVFEKALENILANFPDGYMAKAVCFSKI